MGIVAAAIIRDDDLKIGERLGGKTFQRFVEITGAIAHGNQNGYGREISAVRHMRISHQVLRRFWSDFRLNA